ncbi:Gas vesicle structural protein [Candidatus Desulfosporosinus infrequens]|uniref:Gas vesicle structural protein n=1 Tax=Candidatus Desulfosporosinus infrequens TaxID=2043169 RepID=A0A2U3KXX2_9FIRM|nr:Gas vesicle structural protein [Candidatus Desulfosporosinus infrequens]
MGDIANSKQVTLLAVVEKLLDKGVVISGDLILSCGNVDLVYLNLKVVLTSVQTMLEGNSSKKDVHS